MPRKPERILWKFQCKKGDFWFVIPDEREYWGGDFFVHKKHFSGAEDGNRVRAEVLETTRWKKPEAKIVEVFGKKVSENSQKYEVVKTVEGIYSGGSWDFGFVDVPWEDQGYFVYGLKKNGAKDGDRVRADVKKYNGKQEAIITEILWNDGEIFEGVYSDNNRFWFVKVAGRKDDIFIPGSKKMEANTWDRVKVRIIKDGKRRAEGKIEQIL